MSDATPTEEDLLAAAQQGDERALSQLIERHAPRVFRFGVRMCRDEEDAREVLQDTLLTAARGLREFRGGSALSTWLYAIARSFCIKHRRKAASTELPAPDTEPVDTAPTPEHRAEQREIGVVLEQAILELEPMYREVLLLRDVEGLSANEVAEVLELSVAAVKSRLHRARAQVRQRLAPFFSDAPEREAAGCPDVAGLLSRYLEGEVSSDACREMEQHVAGCAQCAARCDSLRRVLDLCRACPLPAVPSDLQELVRSELRRASQS